MLLQPSLEFEIFEHWAPEHAEILELEKEPALAAQAVSSKLLDDLTKHEEKHRKTTRRKSTYQLETEIVAKLKVKICEKKAELWVGAGSSGR